MSEYLCPACADEVPVSKQGDLCAWCQPGADYERERINSLVVTAMQVYAIDADVTGALFALQCRINKERGDHE